MEKNPRIFVGWEFRDAVVGDHGIQIIDFIAAEGAYVARTIRWSTGEYLDEIVRTITPFRLSNRYCTNIFRRIDSKTTG